MKESRKKRNESLEEKKHAPKVKADQTKVHASETVLCLSFFGVVSVLLSSCRRGVCACVGEKKKSNMSLRVYVLAFNARRIDSQIPKTK